MPEAIAGVAAAKESYEFLKGVYPLIVKGWKFLTRNRVPRAAKGSVGFAVAIKVEKETQRERLASDFIDCLRQSLMSSKLVHPFSFIEIPQDIAAKIKSEEEAKKVLLDSKCRYLIYGKAKLRIIDGAETNVLELNSMVSHREVDPAIKTKVSEEMAELLPPPRVLSKTDGDIFAFELHAKWLNYVSQYIIGIAAFLSGDVDYAQSIFEGLELQLKGNRVNFSQVQELKKRVPKNLTNVLLWQAIIQQLRWRETRDVELLCEMKSYLDLVEAREPGRYQVRLLNSIYYFVVEKSTKRALQMVEECKKIEDPTWKYSKAFLLAYSGKMNDAVRTYNVASKKPCESASVYFELEEFIDWVLSQEPAKVQLHFCLGFVNYRLKEDSQQAIKDFEEFLLATHDGQFPEQRELAKKYITECLGQVP